MPRPELNGATIAVAVLVALGLIALGLGSPGIKLAGAVVIVAAIVLSLTRRRPPPPPPDPPDVPHPRTPEAPFEQERATYRDRTRR